MIATGGCLITMRGTRALYQRFQCLCSSSSWLNCTAQLCCYRTILRRFLMRTISADDLALGRCWDGSSFAPVALFRLPIKAVCLNQENSRHDISPPTRRWVVLFSRTIFLFARSNTLWCVCCCHPVTWSYSRGALTRKWPQAAVEISFASAPCLLCLSQRHGFRGRDGSTSDMSLWRLDIRFTRKGFLLLFCAS